MTDLDRYFDDILDLCPTLAAYYGDKSRKAQFHYENTQSDDFNSNYYKILKKYKRTKHPGLRYLVKTGLAYMRLPFDLMPITSFENPITDFDFMNKTKSIYSPDPKALASRQKDFDVFIATCITRMREGMAIGITIPRIICLELIRDIDASTYPVFTKFLKYEYLPTCRNTIGLCALPNGKAMYRHHIRSTCTFYMSPVKIRAFGKKEVARLSRALIASNKPQPVYYKTRKEIIQQHTLCYKDICKNVLPKYFHHIPATPCKIKPMPRNMEDSGTGAYYLPRLNIFYVNTRDVKEHDMHGMYTLTMHETVPGHHYQYAYMAEKRMTKAQQFAIDNTAFVEGWALYAETLGHQDSGGISAQLFRAVRLVVDTGIHYFGWSYARTLSYMKKHLSSFMKESEIITELKRYICILGKEHILQLRTKYLKTGLGDIKDFHDFLLEDGMIPFEVIDQKLKRLIKINK